MPCSSACCKLTACWHCSASIECCAWYVSMDRLHIIILVMLGSDFPTGRWQSGAKIRTDGAIHNTTQ